jgi:hypothetical protein
LAVFENRVLRRIFGPKREQVAGGWKRLHNEELYNLYASQNVIRVIKSRRVEAQGMDWMRLGCCEHGNEPSGSIKFGEFLEYLSDC